MSNPQYDPYGQPHQGQPQYAPPPAASPKKRRKWPWIVLGVFVLIVIIAGVSGGGDKPTPTAQPTAAPTSATQPAPVAPAAQPAPVAPAEPADDGKDDIRRASSRSG